MSTTKRKDGRYCRSVVTGISDDGKPIRKYIYAKTLKELDQKYRDFMNEKEHGAVIDRSRMTIAELADIWLEREKKPYIRLQSYYFYERWLESMKKYVGHYRVQQFQYADLVALQTRLVGEGKQQLYNLYLYLLRAMLKYAVREEIVYRDITAGAQKLRVGHPKKRHLTDAEITRLKGVECDLSEKAIIYTLFYTGVRVGELCALRWDDVDFSEHTISITKTVVRQVKSSPRVQEMTKTEAGRRKVLMPPALEEVLLALSRDRTCDLVFPNKVGKEMHSHTFYAKWKTISNAIYGEGNAPKDFTPHLLRHNFASMLYKSGTPIKAAQRLLGHADIKTTLDTYTHFELSDFDASALMEYIDS